MLSSSWLYLNDINLKTARMTAGVITLILKEQLEQLTKSICRETQKTPEQLWKRALWGPQSITYTHSKT